MRRGVDHRIVIVASSTAPRARSRIIAFGRSRKSRKGTTRRTVSRFRLWSLPTGERGDSTANTQSRGSWMLRSTSMGARTLRGSTRGNLSLSSLRGTRSPGGRPRDVRGRLAARRAGGRAAPLKEQVMASNRRFPTAQSDQEMVAAPNNRNPVAAQDGNFRQNLMAAMGGASAALRAAPPALPLNTPQVGANNPTTAPNTII